MTDNVTANPSAGGSVFATDFHASETAHWPITKMAWGTRDTNYTIVDLANAIPVQPGTGAIWNIQGGNSTAVKVDGSAVTQPISGSVGVTGTVAVTGTFWQATQPVSGTFWQATQPISAASLPLPAGAATSANQPALSGDGGALAHVTNFPATQSISAASLPLPTNASQDGVDGTGIAAPTGGSGIRGWLSGIYKAITGQVKVIITDPSSGNGALVQAFHNADNQSLSGTSYGIMTGGVDQLVNGSGNLDRKRGVSGDAMAATGLAAEVPMLWNGSTYDRAPGSAASGAKVYSGNSGSDGSSTITTGGTAQNIFAGSTPTNGFFVTNPDPTNDLWISISTTALANGSGSVRIAANGGYFATEPGLKPWQAISIVGAVTGQKFTAVKW